MGYKIQVWQEDKGEASMLEQDIPFGKDIKDGETIEGAVTLLKPYSTMVLQVICEAMNPSAASDCFPKY